MTKTPLTLDDLLPIKVNTTVKPKPAGATSIPGMLAVFHNEWDALMLETHELRKDLHATRQELSHALYQHDAACRVIARLVKERDEARAALADAQGAPGQSRASAPAAPPPPSALLPTSPTPPTSPTTANAPRAASPPPRSTPWPPRRRNCLRRVRSARFPPRSPPRTASPRSLARRRRRVIPPSARESPPSR